MNGGRSITKDVNISFLSLNISIAKNCFLESLLEPSFTGTETLFGEELEPYCLVHFLFF